MKALLEITKLPSPVRWQKHSLKLFSAEFEKNELINYSKYHVVTLYMVGSKPNIIFQQNGWGCSNVVRCHAVTTEII